MKAEAKKTMQQYFEPHLLYQSTFFFCAATDVSTFVCFYLLYVCFSVLSLVFFFSLCLCFPLCHSQSALLFLMWFVLLFFFNKTFVWSFLGTHAHKKDCRSACMMAIQGMPDTYSIELLYKGKGCCCKAYCQWKNDKSLCDWKTEIPVGIVVLVK